MHRETGATCFAPSNPNEQYTCVLDCADGGTALTDNWYWTPFAEEHPWASGEESSDSFSEEQGKTLSEGIRSGGVQ